MPEPITLIAAGLLAAKLFKGGPAVSSSSVVTYRVDPDYPYGPKWGRTRPPGLPATARQTSDRGEALEPVRQLALATVNDPAFAETMRVLVHNESGGRFALPANIFNVLPSDQRGGKSYISAWGAFQWNRDAWRSLSGRRAIGPVTPTPDAMPWDCTPEQELLWPVRRYAELWNQVRSAGGTSQDGTYGVLLWHRGPVYFNEWLRSAASVGFPAAKDSWHVGKDSDRRSNAVAAADQASRVSVA